MIRRNLLALGAFAAGVSAAVMASDPGTASAYVRYRTSKNQPYSWREKSVSITGYPHGLPSMTVDQITTAMTAAVGAWSQEDPANATCSYLSLALTMVPVTTVPPDAVRDNLNTIALRDGSWMSICSTSTDGLEECHQPGELALTTVWSKACGEVVEADVEVNADDQTRPGEGFMWADVDVTGAGGRWQDLQNALTHEMGHFIGLDHTCVLNGIYPLDKNNQPIVPIDNLGQPVPSCSELSYPEPDMNLKPTMYPSADPGDLDKRTLSDDDRAGLCAIYPAGTNPVSCGASTGGCSIAETADHDEPSDHQSGLRGSFWRWLVVGSVGAAGSFVLLRRRRHKPPRR